jgi:hypothetical protein
MIKVFIVNLMLILSSIFVTLAAIEFVLYTINYPTAYNKIQKTIEEIETNQFAKWWVLDPEVGTKFDSSEITKQILDKTFASTPNWERLGVVNASGYHDKDNFISQTAQSSNTRIFFIGDSFTWGASASLGHSFVETFETLVNHTLSKALVWNSAIPASGTGQHLQTLKTYAPIMKPTFVILGFYENDFNDNLLPLNANHRTVSGTAVSKFKYNKIKKSYEKLNKTQTLERLTYNMKQSRIEHLISNALKPKVVITQKNYEPIPESVKITKRFVNEIGAYCKQNNIIFIVLTIPSRETVLTGGSKRYEIMTKIVKEEDAVLVDPLFLLGEENYARLPDDHWNNSGHKLIGEYLYEQFLKID